MMYFIPTGTEQYNDIHYLPNNTIIPNNIIIPNLNIPYCFSCVFFFLKQNLAVPIKALYVFFPGILSP